MMSDKNSESAKLKLSNDEIDYNIDKGISENLDIQDV